MLNDKEKKDIKEIGIEWLEQVSGGVDKCNELICPYCQQHICSAIGLTETEFIQRIKDHLSVCNKG